MIMFESCCDDGFWPCGVTLSVWGVGARGVVLGEGVIGVLLGEGVLGAEYEPPLPE